MCSVVDCLFNYFATQWHQRDKQKQPATYLVSLGYFPNAAWSLLTIVHNSDIPRQWGLWFQREIFTNGWEYFKWQQ